jgi:hypothetical protein
LRGARLPPAVVALVIQGVAFAAALGTWHSASALAFAIGLTALSIAQGLLAAGLSRICRQAPWWHVMHLVFPFAIVASRGVHLHLPAAVFLAAFLLLAGVFRTAHRSQVPYYPSGAAARREVLGVMPSGRLRFIDIGSGTGGLAMHLALQRPESDFSGIELAPLPWMASVLRNRIKSSRVNFVRGDYRALDLSGYDVVFAYLSPVAMPALWQKAKSEMRNGALLLSYEFAIPGVSPDFACAPDSRGRRLFGWRMGAAGDSHPPTSASQVFSWRAVMQEEPGKSMLYPRSRVGRFGGRWTSGNKENQRGRAC